jgi:SAM-dependent methyltransferase
MLVPLYEAVYLRLDVSPGTHLLGLDCGSGLALLMAAARGARVSGTDSDAQRLALARERLLSGEDEVAQEERECRLGNSPEDVVDPGGAAFNLVTAFDPLSYTEADLVPTLSEAAAVAERGSPVVLAGWGPPERCATSSVLRLANRMADRSSGSGAAGAEDRCRPYGRDALEDLAHQAGLRPDGSGRVACPFGYADMDSAVRGLLSTGLFDEAVATTDGAQVEKELTEVLHPHLRQDGTVWMPNIFRYLIARV